MSLTISEEFKKYADFSVRVDRFFNVASIYGTHHEGLKFVYSSMPDYFRRQDFRANENVDEDFKTFMLTLGMTFQLMGATGIFSDDENAIDNSTISADIHNFSFYTCYCFQWTLFENFIKTMIRKAINADVFSQPVKEKLESKWGRTKSFLDYIDSGEVFGRTPFSHLMPVVGWVPKTEEITYADLNKIRELRNKFIHGVESPEITSENIVVKQRQYERSMWVLRKFAENIQFEVQHLIEQAKSS